MDKTIFDEMIATRRHLHRFPEEGWTEFQTTYLIATRLRELGYTDVRLGRQLRLPLIAPSKTVCLKLLFKKSMNSPVVWLF